MPDNRNRQIINSYKPQSYVYDFSSSPGGETAVNSHIKNEVWFREIYASPVQVLLVEHSIQFCALKLSFENCLLNSEKPLISQGFWAFVLYSRTIMAESKGFEPSKRFWRLHDFQSCSFDQLGQLSVSAIKCSSIIYDRAAKIKSFFKNPKLFIFALPAYRINLCLRGINIICKSANFTCFLLYCIEPGDEI